MAFELLARDGAARRGRLEFPRGPVDTPEAVRRRVSLDLEYVERQSLWLDIAIMARTLPCVLGDAGTVR